MAEFYMTYEELSAEIEKYIAEAEGHNLNLEKYKAEIISAIVGDYNKYDLNSVNEAVELWQNQINRPSEWRIGNRYIPIRSMILKFLRAIITSGALDAFISYRATESVSGFTISVGTSIAIAVWELIDSIKQFEDGDLCIYMQALTHLKVNSTFTREDLMEWLPRGEPLICNMHDDTWCCKHRNEDDTCNMVIYDNLDKALNSLIGKNILVELPENQGYEFSK